MLWSPESGEIRPLPCGRVYCEHCGKWHALIRLQMVNDACDRHGSPTLVGTVTSHDPDRALGESWSRDVEKLWKATKLRYAGARYLQFNEWTTGQGRLSGGRRRPHAHFLIWDVTPEEAPMLEALWRRIWLDRTGSTIVDVQALRSEERGIGYLGMHHAKGAQAPPPEWKGRTFRPSKGLWQPDGRQARAIAKETLRDRAGAQRLAEQIRTERHRIESEGAPPEVAELIVDDMTRELARGSRSPVRVMRVTGRDTSGRPTALAEPKRSTRSTT